MRRHARLFLPLIALVLTSLPARGDDFPASIVSWEPIPQNPIFRGEGGKAWDKKIR